MLSQPTEYDWEKRLSTYGFEVFRGVYAADEMKSVAADLVASLHRAASDEQSAVPIRARDGVIYAARNLLDVFPFARTIWDRTRLREALIGLLGEKCGLVRGLYFDKPPEQSWSLPWHQDKTIAVSDNRLPTTYFRNPTRKEGVSHVEAPTDLLQQMLTLRIHLDDVTNANGPLMVLPGSHKQWSAADMATAKAGEATAVLAAAGDVLLMRPLLAHCSGKSHADCQLHRRIVHLEFAAHRELPDGFSWHRFFAVGGSA